MERKKLAEFSPPYFTPVLMWPNPNERKNVFAVKKKLGDVVTYRDAITDEWLQVFHASEWKELNDYEKKELNDERKFTELKFGFIPLDEKPDPNRPVRYYTKSGRVHIQHPDHLQPPQEQFDQFLYWEYADEVKRDIPQDGRTISVGNVSDYVQSATGLKLKSFETLTPEELNQIMERERNANLYYRSSDGTFKQLPEGTTISNYARNSKGDYVEIKSGRIDDPEYQAMSFDKPVDSNFDDIKIKVKKLSVDQLRELIYQNTNPADPDQEFIDLIKMMLDDYLKYKNSGALGLAEDILHNIKEITGDKEREIDQMIVDQKTKDQDA